MQAFLCGFGIWWLAQVSDPAGARYPAVAPIVPPAQSREVALPSEFAEPRALARPGDPAQPGDRRQPGDRTLPAEAYASEAHSPADTAPPLPNQRLPGAASPGAAFPGAAFPSTALPGAASSGAASPGTASLGAASPGTASPGAASPGTVFPGTALPNTGPQDFAPARQTAPAELDKTTSASQLLRSLAEPSRSATLSGAPLTLAEAVQAADSRATQTERVHWYWDLSQAVAHLQLAELETLEIESLQKGLHQPSPVWSTALEAAQLRQQVARRAVETAQVRLQAALGGERPLPADLPHCGTYQTRYDENFQQRRSEEARQLAELLPLEHQQLEQGVLATTDAREWLIHRDKLRSPHNDGVQLLKAYENLALQRRTFVDAVYRYNATIARYAELAVPQAIATGRLVAMLIQTEQPIGDWQRGNIQRTSAEESSPLPGGKPSERSIVVPPSKRMAL